MISLRKLIKRVLVGIFFFVVLAIAINFWFMPTTNALMFANNATIDDMENTIASVNLPIRVLDNIHTQIQNNPANINNQNLVEAYLNNQNSILTEAAQIIEQSEIVRSKLDEINNFSLNRHSGTTAIMLRLVDDIKSIAQSTLEDVQIRKINEIQIDQLKSNEGLLVVAIDELNLQNELFNQLIVNDFTIIINTIFLAMIILLILLSLGILKYVTYDQQFILNSFINIEKKQFDFNALPKNKMFFEEEKEIHDRIKEIFEEERFIQKVEDIIVKTYHIDDLIEKLFNTLSDHIGIDRVGIAFVDYSNKNFVAEFGKSSYSRILLGPGFEVNFDNTSLTNILKTKTAFITADLGAELMKRPTSASLLLLKEEGIMSNMVVPMLMGDRVFGVVFFSSLEKNYFNQQHLKLAEKLIYEISGFLNRAYFTKVILSKITSGFSELVDQKDNETGDHIERMVKYSVIIAEGLMKHNIPGYEVDRKFVLEIERNAASHDIGKVGIPDEILKKPGKLTPEEWIIMKTHVTIGSEIFRSFKEDLQVFEADFYKTAEEIARSHHERWDGTGYPDGLADSEIPLSARIVAIADVFDALTSKRHYKDAFGFENSIDIIKQSAGSHLDPILVEVFIENLDRVKAIYDIDFLSK